jgi:hypothetical protein
VILGMTDPKKAFPIEGLRHSSHWIRRPGVSLGTLALSSDVFLDGRLVPLLASINGATTFVFTGFGMDMSNWLVSAATWRRMYEKDKDDTIFATNWERICGDNHALE